MRDANGRFIKKTTGNKVLVLRTCNPDMTSAHKEAKGFRWPESGPVSCSDWDPKPECGHGLHGLKLGRGDYGLLSGELDAKWLVVEVEESEIVEIDDGMKCKFPRGVVVYCGDRAIATTMVFNTLHAWLLAQKETTTATSGDNSGAATSGDSSGAATSGNRSGAATSGYGSGAATSGNRSGAATSGNRSGAATSGDGSGAATSGNRSGAATSGYGSEASATGKDTFAFGHERARVGDNGMLILRWWSETDNRWRCTVGYSGEGIKAGVWYTVDEKGTLVEEA